MKAIIDGTEYVDVKEAAAIADYTEEHVRRLARQGRIDSVKRGTMVFLSLASLKQYVREMRTLGTEKHSPWRNAAR